MKEEAPRGSEQLSRLIAVLFTPVLAEADSRLDGLKKTTIQEVQKKAEFTQQMVDMIFSCAELDFQEYETSRYLTDILEKNGFEVEKGVAGIPTAFVAKWGSVSP